MILSSESAAKAYVARRCDSVDLARLEEFVDLLSVASERQNLVSKGSISSVWQRHIADSAQLVDHVPRETGPWLDLGSGAGFPGLIVAIIAPNRRVILVESRNLRIEWLNSVIDTLRIVNCEVRGNDLRRVQSFEAGVISARAFAPLDRLVAQSARFSTTDTRWLLPKGRSARQEVAALPAHLHAMFHVEQSVTDAEAGIVVGTGQVEIAA